MVKKLIFSGCIILVVLFGALAVRHFWSERYEQKTRVVFLSVGEGDAILLSQGSNQILIDGGRNGKELLSHLGRYVPFWDRTIETVIATHPDADHIGGFPDLLRTYTVDTFLSTGAESETDIFLLLKKRLEDFSVRQEKIALGSTIAFPFGGTIEVLYPTTLLPKETKESNKGSLVMRFTYKETTMLFTGDLPSEETLLSTIQPIDVLKVSHHGSRYSTSEVFLDQITPKEAVISVGENRYGHPSPDVLDRLRNKHVTIRRTDTDGDIQYSCTEIFQTCFFTQ